MKIQLQLIIAVLFFNGSLAAQVYQDSALPVANVSNGDGAWADFDNDGDLDLILTGYPDDGGTAATKVFIYDTGNFIDASTSISAVTNSDVDLADFDNDGLIDIAICGNDNGSGLCQIWRNSGAGFDLHQTLIGIKRGSLAWADVDNDGDFDLFASGEDDGSTIISTIYINSAGSFNGLPAAVTGIPGFTDGDAQWFDYDKDGDQDLMIAGAFSGGPATRIYRNDGTSFNNGGFTFPDMDQSAIAIGDIDNDGDQDVAICGFDHSVSPVEIKTFLFKNNISDFNAFPASITGVKGGDIALGDYDNDGDLDLALTGGTASGGFTSIFRNDAGSFVEAGEALIALSSSSIAFGDMDGDHDLDLLVTGLSMVVSRSRVYLNTVSTANAPPAMPGIINQNVSGNRVTLSWSGATDVNQANPALTYNLRVGTTLNGADIMNPMAHPTIGKRSVVAPGNVGQNNEWTLNLLDAGTYYWSVQAIDNSYEGSEFPGAGSFTINPIGEVTLLSPNGGEQFEIGSYQNINWNSNGIAQVKLEFRVNDTASWITIVDQVSATSGSYAWQVPAIESDLCRIRISSVASPGTFDISDGTFGMGDFSPPVISNLNYDYNHSFGQDLPVAVNVTDNTGLLSVKLFYRKGGEPTFNSEPMNDAGNDVFEALISATEFNERGIEFYVEAIDLYSNRATTDTNDVEIFIAGGVGNPISFPAGSTVESYRIFSIPFVMDNKSPQAFLTTNNLGDYDPTRFRWFGLINENLVEFPDFGNMNPGQAWFYLSKEPDVNFSTGSGHPYSSLEWYSVNLPANSWSLIGSPYNYNIPFDSLYTDPEVNIQIWEFNGVWALNTAGFEPWKGYAVYSPGATTLYLNPEMAGLSKPLSTYSTNNNSGADWLVRIIAEDDFSRSDFNFIGQKNGARESFDSFDLVHPPRIAKQVQVLIDRLTESAHNPLIADVRPADSEGQRWDFTAVVNDASEKLSLHFDGVSTVRSDFEIIMVDEYTGREYNLRTNPQMEILVKKSNQRDFHIIAGTRNFLENQISVNDALMPTQFALQQNFPNPFNPSTQIDFDLPQDSHVQIRIYDATGKQVDQIVNAVLPVGRHSLVWNASTFSSGVYLIQLQTDKFHAVRKAMLIK